MPKSTQPRKDLKVKVNIQIHPYIFSQYSEDVGTVAKARCFTAHRETFSAYLQLGFLH